MRIVPFADEDAQHAALPELVAHLRAGGLILYPTETVFGLGGLSGAAPAAALAQLKARDAAKPFILLISDLRQAEGLAWTPQALRLAEEVWPGPLTLVLRDQDGRYPPRIASETGRAARPAPPHAGIRLLLEALGEPVTSTSANAPGARPAETSDEARALFRELPVHANVWMLDGPAGGAAPSTIVDCTGARPRLVRAGAVPIERIREIVHDIDA